MQGDHDIQVTVKDAELLANAKKDAQLFIIKGMNHIFKMVSTDDRNENIKTYSNPNLPISISFLEKIISFIKQ